MIMYFNIILSLFIIFLERGEGREKGRERNIHVEDKHGSAASPMSPVGA